MRYLLFILTTIVFALSVNQSALAQDRPADGMSSYKSEFGVDETVKRLVSRLQDNNMRIFTTVNHSAGAESVDMELPATKLVIFGNPEVGTPLMKCARTTAIDLPQKMLVWQDEQENVHIGYNDPLYLDMRHQLGDECEKYINKISNALQNFATHAAGVKK